FNGKSDFALVRYQYNGQVDPLFGSGGLARTDFFGDNDSANAMAVGPNGKIVVVGDVIQNGVQKVGIACYTADGDLDLNFGPQHNGKIVLSYPLATETRANAVAIQNNAILVGGSAFIGGDNDFWLARVDLDGNPDNQFGSSGQTTLNFGNGEDDRVYGI